MSDRPVEKRQGSGLGPRIPAEEGRMRLERYARETKPPLWGRLTESATVYHPDHATHIYRILWDEDQGYRVQRRLPPDHPYNHWPRSSEVENWIQLDGGMWDRSWSARPIVRFASLAEAEAIITADLP